MMLLVSVVFLFASLASTGADVLRFDYLPVGHVRTDPILSQTCLSGHVHSFYGPPLLHPAVTYNELRTSDPELSSGNIKENLSLYWHPSIYRVNHDGTKTLMSSNMTTLYYEYVLGETRAFPPGFRLIGLEAIDAQTSCAGESPCTRPGCDMAPTNTFFPTFACEELEVFMGFPHCWDGVRLESQDQSHVVRSLGDGGIEDACPASHPVRLPKVEFFFRIVGYDGGRYEFSDGTGHFHADYIAGWDEQFLQNILDTCSSEGATDTRNCPFTFRDNIIYSDDFPDGDRTFVQMLKDNAVPLADTSCITDETITGIANLPMGSCNGTLISANGVCNNPPPATCANMGEACNVFATCCEGSSCVGGVCARRFTCDNSKWSKVNVYMPWRDEVVSRSCNWLGMQPWRLNRWCQELDRDANVPVMEICQKECSQWSGCCDNSPWNMIHVYMPWRDEVVSRSCNWLGKAAWRLNRWCQARDPNANVAVMEICQKECSQWTGC